MKTIVFLLMPLILMLGFLTNANAKTLFADDFEDGLSKEWVIANQNGEGKWKVVS